MYSIALFAIRVDANSELHYKFIDYWMLPLVPRVGERIVVAQRRYRISEVVYRVGNKLATDGSMHIDVNLNAYEEQTT